MEDEHLNLRKAFAYYDLDDVYFQALKQDLPVIHSFPKLTPAEQPKAYDLQAKVFEIGLTVTAGAVVVWWVRGLLNSN
jgi:hypothetical protein